MTFLLYFKLFWCLIHAFSRNLCEPWLGYTGLAMSELRTTSICETARMSCHQVILHNGVLYPLTLCPKANACARNLGFHCKGRLRPRCWRKHLYSTSQKKKLRGGQKKLHNKQPWLFDFFIGYYSFHQIKEDRVGAASSTHRRQTKCIHSKMGQEKNSCKIKA